MNYAGAKTALIIAFLALNIFLGYRVWAEHQSVPESLVSKELERLELRLEEKNLALAVPLPRHEQLSTFLTVKPFPYTEQLLDKLGNGRGMQQHDQDGYLLRIPGEALLSVNALGLVQYEVQRDLPVEESPLDEHQALEIWRKFIEQKGLALPDLRLDYSRAQAGERVLHYYQVYEDLPIFAGQLTVAVDRAGVRRLSFLFLDAQGFADQGVMNVISAITALNSLLAEIDAADTRQVITAMNLGYYSSDYDAEQWEMPLVWRIVVSKQKVYYINAFTGNIEDTNYI